MKAVLVQLPVQSHDYGYSLENIPLAAGYLKAAAGARFGPAVEVEICPPDTASLGGDAAVLKWVKAQAPDVAGFTCCLWNVERSLHLCKRLRQELPGLKVVLGGPEIGPDNTLLPGADFDAAVAGEGEAAFLDLLEAWRNGADDLSSIPGLVLPGPGGLGATPRREPMSSLDVVPSPWLTGVLGASYSGTIFLETVRGCVHRCSYCSYHKQFKRLRPFDLGRTAAEVRWALENGAREISFIDPCFAARPGIGDLLRILEDAQRARLLEVSCELNAEDLDKALVDSLARAGVRHVEVGLQSTNPKALKLCGRRFDRGLFTRGVRMLVDAGVRVTTDLMVGLPGDTLADFGRSLDFVLSEGLSTTLNLYPVSVLPNTILRGQAPRLGMSFQNRPPYYVTSTPDMGADDMREAFARAEALTGESYFPVELPRRAGMPSREGDARHVARIVIGPEKGGELPEPATVGMALAVELTYPEWPGDWEEIREKLRPLLEENPYTLLSVIVPAQDFRPGEARGLASSLPPRAPHPCDREHMSTRPGQCSVQVFLETPLEGGGKAFTLLPPEGGPCGVDVFLPAEAGQGEEDALGEAMGIVMGSGNGLRFHDLPDDEAPGLDLRLATVFLP